MVNPMEFKCRKALVVHKTIPRFAPGLEPKQNLKECNNLSVSKIYIFSYIRGEVKSLHDVTGIVVNYFENIHISC